VSGASNGPIVVDIKLVPRLPILRLAQRDVQPVVSACPAGAVAMVITFFLGRDQLALSGDCNHCGVRSFMEKPGSRQVEHVVVIGIHQESVLSPADGDGHTQIE
jgi:hypothetical protein